MMHIAHVHEASGRTLDLQGSLLDTYVVRHLAEHGIHNLWSDMY